MRKLVSIAAIAIITVAMGLAALILLPHDQFSQYEVLSSDKDAGSNQHAVTYKVYHSNSSSTVSATWVLPNPRLLARPRSSFGATCRMCHRNG
jgi:hypothetical protein